MIVVPVACFCRLLAVSGPGDPEQSRSKDGTFGSGVIGKPARHRGENFAVLIFAAFSAAA